MAVVVARRIWTPGSLSSPPLRARAAGIAGAASSSSCTSYGPASPRICFIARRPTGDGGATGGGFPRVSTCVSLPAGRLGFRHHVAERQPAAVRIDGMAGALGTVVAGQEQRRAGGFVRPPGAAGRGTGAPAVPPPRIGRKP